MNGAVTIHDVVPRYLHVIRRVANRNRIRGMEPEDVVQTVVLVLMRSIHNFDPEKLSLEKYVSMAAKRAVITQYQLSKGKQRSFAKEACDIADVRPAAKYSDPLEEMIAQEKLRRVLSDLTKQERKVFDAYYQSPCNVSEVAALLGRNVTSINNAIARIREKHQRHGLCPPRSDNAAAIRERGSVASRLYRKKKQGMKAEIAERSGNGGGTGTNHDYQNI